MAYKDIRDYFEALERAGAGVRVKQEVDWDLEATAIVRRLYETDGPAVFFEKVKDYPGHRLCGALLNTYRKLNFALGLPLDTPLLDFYREYERRLRNPIKPTVVRNGPCKEVKILDPDKVDILSFPVPMVHDGDGGRYFTFHFAGAKDPHSDWQNWGMYRMMVHNRNHAGIFMGQGGQTGSFFFRYYLPRKQPMPVAIVIGCDPLCFWSVLASVPRGQDEAEIAGALNQEPLELVKCETNDLLVPAHAEIVLEGEVLTDETADEGPFGEAPGYRCSPRLPRLLFRCNAITHRRNPVFTTSSNGIQPDDHLPMSVAGWVSTKNRLQAAGIPYTGIAHHLGFTVIGVETRYSHMATQIWNMLGASWLIVVDADVNIYDEKEVFDALVKRCHPTRGIITQYGVPAMALTPYLSLEERQWGHGARVLFDATWPLEWDKQIAVPPRMAFREEDCYPKEVQEKVLSNWKSYGFSD